MKKTLILAAILALTTSTVFAAETKTAPAKTTQAQSERPCPMGPPPEMRGRDNHKAQFEQRLKLTDKQKAQINKNREADKAKMKPIMDKIQQKEQAKREIFKKYEQTDADLIKLNKEINELKTQRHKIMEQNRKSFESVLTKSQKEELQKMKAERDKNGKGPKGHKGFDGPRPPRPDFD